MVGYGYTYREETTVTDLNEHFIRPGGAAVRAGVSVSTVQRWMRTGRLRRYKDGRGRVWVDRREVDALNAPTPVVTGAQR